MVKRILLVILGTLLLGLGVAFYKLSSLGQDAFSAFNFSIVYLVDKSWFSYSVCYIIVNIIIFLFMIKLTPKLIGIGTIINLVGTGLCSDLFIWLFSLININWVLALKVIAGIMGVIFVALGIVIYTKANLGVAPYDDIPNFLMLKFPKLKFAVGRVIVDLTFAFLAFVIGVLVLKRADIIGINTVISFTLCGPLIGLFNKILKKTN